MRRVHFIVVLKNKSTGEIFLDTEIVEAENVSKAKNYLVESFKNSKWDELITYRVGRLITIDAIEKIN